jgi:hypothetical protein
MGIDGRVPDLCRRAILSVTIICLLLPNWLKGGASTQNGVVAAGPINDLRGFQRQTMGEWRAANGHVVQKQDKGTSLLLFGDRNWGDYSVSVRVRLPQSTSEAEAGLLIHFNDMDDYLVFSVKNRKGGPEAILRIVHKKPGMSIYADESPIADSLERWHELKADVHGVDIQGYVDGKLCVAYSFQGTPPPYNTHGKTWDPDLDHGWTGILAVDTPAEYADFRVRPLAASIHIVTPQRGAWSLQGKLLPRQSYADTMQRLTDWLMQSSKVIYTGKAPATLRGEEPYLLGSFVTSDNQLLGTGGEFAFNHALLISGAVQYYIFTGERKYLRIAEETADWEIAHSTPADWAWPNMAPSFITFKSDGTWEGQDWGLEPDKSAYMGFSYLKLYATDGDEKYLQAARKIAATLEQHQDPEGNFPFRVNARTGEVKYAYTCSQLWYVWFFEKLAEITGDNSYMKFRQGAFQWLLNNPVKTNRWLGLYGDIASGAKSYDQWVALETGMYLIDRRAHHPEYVSIAKGILNWLNSFLVVDYGFFPGIPGVVEQSQYKVVLTHHELRLAEMYAKLWEANGDPKDRDMAEQIANSVTWNLMSDGKMRQGFWYHAWGVPLGLSFNDQFSRIMACIPETAPKGENHLLQSTSFVKAIEYQPTGISYHTVGESYDYLVVASAPKLVRSGGRLLPAVKDPRVETEGWNYNERTGLFRVRHAASDVEVSFR